jgi:hypothetical protein
MQNTEAWRFCTTAPSLTNLRHLPHDLRGHVASNCPPGHQDLDRTRLACGIEHPNRITNEIEPHCAVRYGLQRSLVPGPRRSGGH